MDAVGVAGEVINVATGVRTSLNQAWTTLGNIVGPLPQPVHQPSRAGDVRHSQADIGKAETLLGYRPGVGFDEGLRRTVEWAQTGT
jgi:nucleoside-diphosphate-sugar epimerase